MMCENINKFNQFFDVFMLTTQNEIIQKTM